MVDKKVTPDPISSDVYTMFSSGQLAMVGAGRWVLNTWQDAGMKNFDCVQWPKKTEEGQCIWRFRMVYRFHDKGEKNWLSNC